MSGFLGPEDPWPEHPRAEWNRTLRFARKRGWHLKTTNDHAWGHLYCTIGVAERGPDRHQGVCDLTIYSSAKATDSVAKEYHRKIARCPHQPSAPTPEQARNIARAAESFLNEAQDLIQGLAEQRAASEELDVMDTTKPGGEEMLAGVFARGVHGEELAAKAVGATLAAGVDPGEPPDPLVILDEVASLLSEAKRIVHGSSSAAARSVRDTLKELGKRHERLSRGVRKL